MAYDPDKIIITEGPPDFWVEVWNDDDSHFIRLFAFGRFDPALAKWRELVEPEPDMRVVMRHRAHVYRNYIPKRLHNRYDRSKEYPTGF